MPRKRKRPLPGKRQKMPCWKNIPMHRNGWTRLPALLGRVEQLAVAGEWTPLYDLLTPYVLGMEELPGLKGMKKRLNGEHKKSHPHPRR